MIAKLITAYGKQVILACDANCAKAFGISRRPKIEYEDPDDYTFLADSEVPDAPAPLCWEGPDGKPETPEERLNKWCFRQCERSVSGTLIQIPDWSVRRHNLKSRQAQFPSASVSLPEPEHV
jgi:hypothetical protein